MRPLHPEAVQGGAASTAIGQARSIVSSFGRRGSYKRAHPWANGCLHFA